MATLKDVAERVGVSITTVSRVLTAAIEEVCYKIGYKLFFCTSGGHPDRERELFSSLRGNNVAGVLVCSRITDASLYTDMDVPMVSIERTIEDVPSVSCDNYKGGVLAAQELLLSGCKAPMLFGNRIVSKNLPAELRYQGFRDACAKAGKPCSEYYISDYCAISTVARPIRQMGELAVDLLIKRINGHMIRQMRVLSLTEPIPA